MHIFFQKFPMEFKETTAIKMIHKKIECAQKKCAEKDETYIRDLAKAHEMIEAFFDEKDINPASLI